MNLSDFISYDAVGLCELIARGEVGRSEVRRAANEAIDVMNPHINAVVHRFWVPGESSATSESPLAGFPLLLKDMLDLENTPMTVGTRIAKGNRCKATHPIVQRMLGAGIDVVGRTNMSELGLLPSSEPIAYGATHNPWNPEHSPGGSSGGAAAAVASGMTPMAYAADGGGSIRIPAACCGLFGLKPSRNLHPRDSADEPFGYITHNPLSRTVRDTAALMDVTAARGSHFRDALHREPGTLRIGFITQTYDGSAVHEACQHAVHDAAALFEELGHNVEAVQVPPALTQIGWGLRVFWTMAAGYFFKQVRSGLMERVDQRISSAVPPVRLLRRALQLPWPGGPLVEPFTAAVGRLDRFFAPSDVWLAWTEFQHAEQALHTFFADYDILLTPTMAAPPWKTGHFDQTLPAEQAEAFLQAYVPHTPVFNMTGYPAMNLPLYWHDGLPIGVQCVAEHNRDDDLISFAAQVELARPWHEKRPPLHLSNLSARDSSARHAEQVRHAG